MNLINAKTDKSAAKARRLAKKTGITHHVYDVSKGGGKGFRKIVAEPVNWTVEGADGVMTLLYTAEAKPVR